MTEETLYSFMVAVLLLVITTSLTIDEYKGTPTSSTLPAIVTILIYRSYRDLISGRFGLPLCAKDPCTFSSPFSRLRVGIPFGLPLGTGSSLLRLHSNGEHLRHPESQGCDSSPSSFRYPKLACVLSTCWGSLRAEALGQFLLAITYRSS